MPIYEYKCEGCGEQFEYMQSISEAPKSECESCGGALKKQISAAAFSFKGGGWYKDLYASPKPESKASSSDSGGESKKSEGKSESKSTSESKPKAGGAGGGGKE